MGCFQQMEHGQKQVHHPEAETFHKDLCFHLLPGLRDSYGKLQDPQKWQRHVIIRRMTPASVFSHPSVDMSKKSPFTSEHYWVWGLGWEPTTLINIQCHLFCVLHLIAPQNTHTEWMNEWIRQASWELNDSMPYTWVCLRKPRKLKVSNIKPSSSAIKGSCGIASQTSFCRSP